MKNSFIQKLIILFLFLFIFYACEDSNNENLCEDVTCSNHGVCKVEDDAAKCICDNGYINDVDNTCIEEIISICDPNPCENSNKTICTAENGLAVCSCNSGYSEDSNGDCVLDVVDVCNPNPCEDLNKTICTPENGLAVCSCNSGYSEDSNGDCIEIVVDVCDPNPCENSNKTICTAENGIAVCSCNNGYTEDTNGDCIMDILDVCKDVTCSDRGECIEVDGEATCNCNYTHLSWEADCIEKITFFDMAISEESNEKLNYFWENYEGPIRNSEKVLFVTRSEVNEVIKLAGTFNRWSPNDIIMDTVQFNQSFRYKKIDITNNEKIYYKYITDVWYPDPRNIFFDFNEDKNSIVYPLNSSRIAKIIVPSPDLNNEEREIYIYFPSLYFTSNKKFPVMYMQDGDNIFQGNPKATYGTWDVGITADEAISEGAVEPLIIVGITTNNRGGEYLHLYIERLDNDILLPEYTNYLVNTLKPSIDNRFKTLKDKDNTAIAGSSLGGISSFFISWQNPEVFSKAGVFSPSSWIGEIEEFNPNAIESMRDLILSTETMPELKIYIDSGNKNFDDSYDYYADSRGYTEYVRNMLVSKGWNLRDEWLESGESELIDYPSTVDLSTVPTIYWSADTPDGYSSYYDYLKPENNLLHLVGDGHVHNESAWKQRFKAALIFLFPNN